MKFYADEVRRHPWPQSVSVAGDHARIERAAALLGKRFGIRFAVLWRGKTISYAYPRTFQATQKITLAKVCTWLIFAHEVAHLIEFRRHGETSHTKRLAAIVDEVIEVLESGQWIAASLDAQACAVLG